jgi:hypothetical protein
VVEEHAGRIEQPQHRHLCQQYVLYLLIQCLALVVVRL